MHNILCPCLDNVRISHSTTTVFCKILTTTQITTGNNFHVAELAIVMHSFHKNVSFRKAANGAWQTFLLRYVCICRVEQSTPTLLWMKVYALLGVAAEWLRWVPECCHASEREVVTTLLERYSLDIASRGAPPRHRFLPVPGNIASRDALRDIASHQKGNHANIYSRLSTNNNQRLKY